MFVIACKWTEKSLILDCVNSIIKFHPEEKIVVVDSNSDNKEYFKKLPQNVIVADINNNNYLSVPEKHNCLNKNFDTYKYQYNSNILGGTGKYLSWELFRSEIGVDSDDITKTQSEGKFFKDREIYRLGIQFYNKKAQISLPKWITDFKVNVLEEETNLNGFYATLKVKFNPDGSGHIANGKISWTAAGDATYEGIIKAKSGIIGG